MEFEKVSYRAWEVYSDSGNIYPVYFNVWNKKWYCGCEGFRVHGTWCSHIRYVLGIKKMKLINSNLIDSDLSKFLKKAGYKRLENIADANSAALAAEVTSAGLEMGVTRAQKLIANARYTIADKSIIFRSAEAMIKYKDEFVKKISTGSDKLDRVLGGGIHTDCTTLFTGQFGTGKSQICMQLCVNSVIEHGRKSVYLVTESSTVPPERMLQMAVLKHGWIPKGYDAKRLSEKLTSASGDSWSVNEDEAKKHMKNFKGLFDWGVDSISPWDSDFILVDPASLRTPEKVIKALQQIEEQIVDNGLDVGIIIIDSVTSLLREAYSGRGTLSERGEALKQLNQIMQRMSSKYNLAMVGTGQVYGNPDAKIAGVARRKFGMNQTPWGGEYFLHSWAFQIGLKLMKGGPSTKEKWVAYTYDCPVPRAQAEFVITSPGIMDV